MNHLGIFLKQLQEEYHRVQLLPSDPLEFVHRYKDPWDQESVALISALLAYGRVSQIRKSLEEALARIQTLADHPKDFVKRLHEIQFRKDAERTFEGYVHRFNTGKDIVQIFALLNRSWSEYGSLGHHFLTYLDQGDRTIENALSKLMSCWRSWSFSQKPNPSFAFFLTSPDSKSCCKRWCLFLRWMGRHDQIDPGLWTEKGALITAQPLPSSKNRNFLHSRQLVMPLDTHSGRISQYLGLTKQNSLNWKAALEVTRSLRKLDPLDPTRFDFAISRLGILELCKKKYRKEICKKCQILPVCQFAKKNSQTID